MMEMSLKQSTLVLLTVAVAVMVTSAQVTISLDEEQPKRNEVPLGSNLTLYCNLTIEKQGRFRVSWFFNRSGPTFNNDIPELTSKVFNRSTKNSTEASSNTKQGLDDTEETFLKYSVLNVTQNNSGWYLCKVKEEIPTLRDIGIRAAEVIIVKNLTEHTSYKPQVPVSVSHNNAAWLDEWWMWIALGVSILVLIVLLIVCVFMTRRLRRIRAPECPVYANMHPKPSPRPETPASKLKTVSSSQNLRTGGPYEEGKRKYKP